MSAAIKPADLEAACRALIRVSETSLGAEIQLPVFYPTGDTATVVVAQQADGFVVHDAGFAVMALADHGVQISRRMHERITATALHYGCEFLDDRMNRHATLNELPLAVAIVANASRTVADQIFQSAPAPVFSFKQEVIERVKQFMGSNRVRENHVVEGKSGTQYSIGAAILDNKETAPVAFVEAVKDHEGVNKRFREFYDIAQSKIADDTARIVLYDDRAALRQTDLIILQDVSNVVRLSDMEARLETFAKH